MAGLERARPQPFRLELDALDQCTQLHASFFGVGLKLFAQAPGGVKDPRKLRRIEAARFKRRNDVDLAGVDVRFLSGLKN